MNRTRSLRLSLLLVPTLVASAAFGGGLDPLVPFAYQAVGVTNGIAELRRIREATGLHRFLLCALGFNEVMYRPFPGDLYERIGRDVEAFRQGLADTDLRDILLVLMGECTEAWEALPLVRDAELMRRILYSGVWSGMPLFAEAE